jgi:hypothetical protein
MARWAGLILSAWALLVPWRAMCVGTWSSVAPGAIKPVVTLMLLLPDGTVMAAEAGTSSNWYRLTPDVHGSYINGTWSNLHPMNDARQFYASAVLRDGRVFVAGGEYSTGGGGAKAEVYNPANNSWTEIPVPSGLLNTNNGNPGFSDSGCMLLPDGTVMISPVTPAVYGGTVLFDPTSNTLSQGPILTNGAYNTDEQSWVKLPDDSILTFGKDLHSQRYIPSLGQWIPDRDLPVELYNFATEIGAGLLLPDGRAFYLGSTGTNVFYTPSGTTGRGTWTQATNIPGAFCAWDNPAAMTVDGKVLCFFGCGQNPNGIYEFEPAADTFIPAGSWDTSGRPHAMLALPDGNILMGDGLTTVVHVYIPSGAPIPAGKPAISSITANIAGVSYHLTGTKLNGISAGAAFGDDAQMDSNYPLVRLTDSGGDVYYARTYNWSSTGVATGSAVVSTEFAVPGAVPPGTYSLVVVVNGNPSDPVSFIYNGPVWVDFNYTIGAEDGSYAFPFDTLAKGLSAVSSGGTIAIKPGLSHETLTVSTPTTITAVGGSATIGQ